MLAAAGFGVLLPGWWGRPSTRLGARLTAHSPTAPGTVAGKSAARPGRPRRLPVGAGARRRAAHRGRAGGAGRAQVAAGPAARPVGRAGRQAAGRRAEDAARQRPRADDASPSCCGRTVAAGADAPGGLPVLGVAADGWLGELLSGQADRRLEPVAAAAGFHGTLRPVPGTGSGLAGLPRSRSGSAASWPTTWAWARRSSCWRCCADARAAGGPTLLVCPMSLVGNWQREAARFAPELRVHVHHGAERARGTEFTAAVARRRPGGHHLRAGRPRRRRAAPRSPGTGWSSTRPRRSRTPPPGRRSRSGRCRRGTGSPSPAPRSRTDSPTCGRIMEFANPGLLGTAAAFKKRFAEPVERHGDDDAAAELRTAHRPVHPAPGEDRPVDHRRPAGEARDGRALQPHRRAGVALPGRGRRHADPHRVQPTASSGAAWCWPR